MERQAEAQSGSVVLREQDVSALENMCGDTSGYFYRMLDYLDQRIRDGVRLGTFTEEQARADLDLALWYSYACNNIGDYDYYYKAAQWMPASWNFLLNLKIFRNYLTIDKSKSMCSVSNL